MSTLAFEFISVEAARALLGQLRSVSRSFSGRKEQRAAAVDLLRMGDHLLKDIGMTRLDIRAAEYGFRTWRAGHE